MDSALLLLAGAIFLCINFFPKSFFFASTFNVFFEKVSKVCRVVYLHQNFAFFFWVGLKLCTLLENSVK
jgi:hypothetical protein